MVFGQRSRRGRCPIEKGDFVHLYVCPFIRPSPQQGLMALWPGLKGVTTKMSSIFCPKRKCPGTVLSSNDFVQFRTSHFAPFEFTMLVNLYFALRTSHLTPQLQEEKKVLFLLFALRASRILSFSLFDAYFSIFCLTRFFNERE